MALSWKALPDLQAFIKVDTQTNDIFFFILGFIVVLGVINTMLMSVLERVHGGVMAVGMRPKLRRLGTLEGFLLGLASAFWYSLGYHLTYHWTSELDFSEAMGETMMVEGVMDAVVANTRRREC